MINQERDKQTDRQTDVLQTDRRTADRNTRENLQCVTYKKILDLRRRHLKKLNKESSLIVILNRTKKIDCVKDK